MPLSRPDWADDVSDNEADPTALPQPTTTVNKDGTKTTISYRIDDSGRKVKVTRKTRTTVHKEKVNPAVAERRSWAKFGLEKGKSKGPQPDTTSVGENIQFRPSRDWKSVQAEDAKNGGPKGGAPDERSIKEQLKDKKVKCRICSGEHFTARCPYKDTMAPVDAEGAAIDPLAEDGGSQEKAEGGLGVGGSSYVPPHLRKGGAGTGERMGGKYERDDLATLRVTNVSQSLGSGNKKRVLLTTFARRSQKWPRSRIYEKCSSALDGSRESSLQRTEILDVRKALRSYLLSIGPMQLVLARRWMALAIDISFFESNLRREPLRSKLEYETRMDYSGTSDDRYLRVMTIT